MGTLVAVMLDPGIQIGLRFLQRQVPFSSESDPTELLQNRFVKAFANAICPRMPGFGLGVLEIQLVVVRFRFAAVLHVSISEDAQYVHAVFGKVGQYPVIKQIGAVIGVLVVQRLAKTPLGAHARLITSNSSIKTEFPAYLSPSRKPEKSDSWVRNNAKRPRPEYFMRSE
jgi:hypothetical protein